MAEETKNIETVIDFIPPPYGTVFKVFFKVWDFAHNWGRSDPIVAALAYLQGQIQKLRDDLQRLDQRVSILGRKVAEIENRNRLQRLAAFTADIERVQFRLSQQPADTNERALIAFDAGAITEVFLNDFDLWLWTDVLITREYDDFDVLVNTAEDPMTPDFKAYPALPVYLSAVMTWLAAIDFDTGGNYQLVQQRYGDRLRRHLAKVFTRPNWNELEQDPDTFPEHIMARITCYPEAHHKFARHEECSFSILCNNVMDRRVTWVRDFVLVMPPVPGNVLCTADPNAGVLDEREIEEYRGVQALTELGEILGRVERTGSLREPFIGQFATTPFYNVAFIYAVNDAGELLWFRQRPSSQLGVLTGWDGPRIVGTGWGSFLSLIPAGGNRFYALGADGVLYWYQHEGFNDGAFRWRGPMETGAFGWNILSRIVPGSDGVLYAQEGANGDLWWYRHDGFRDGFLQTWRGPLHVGSGWHQYKTVFSGGGGIIYAVGSDGILWWHRHKGFENGANSWEGPRQIGWGWQNFTSIFSVGEGVLYAVQPNGTLLWYRYTAWNTGNPAGRWEGPVIAASNGWTGYRHLFPILPATPDPIH
jgi:hypothetical protein